ncbi:helix-turn-helix domain-containing protein [Kibdelosporangium aridum]|uniref:helix-turn-helix domain-containing protein n=1 Tax=Kibdelosporangium aridum TaxID=2030 RepID=UPI00135A38F9
MLRLKVLDLLKAGRAAAQVAHDVQISEQTIYIWCRQEHVDADAHRRCRPPHITAHGHWVRVSNAG